MIQNRRILNVLTVFITKAVSAHLVFLSFALPNPSIAFTTTNRSKYYESLTTKQRYTNGTKDCSSANIIFKKFINACAKDIYLNIARKRLVNA